MNRRGIALPVVLTYLMIFAFEIAGLTEYVSGSSKQIKTQMNQMRAFYNTETGIEKALAEVRLSIQKTGVAPADFTNINLHKPNLYNVGGGFSNYNVSYQGADWTNKVLTAGDYAGLNGNTRTVNIAVTGTGPGGKSQTITQTVEIQHIPVFQFGVFYQNDLEILPGGVMTFSGPVHTNGNLYVGSDGSTLHFDSKITAYGNIYHGRKDSSAAVNGAVDINDASGVDQSMNLGGNVWLDSNHPNWLLDSQTRWGGNVSSSVHGTRSLNLPLPTGAAPHALIERRDGSDTSQVMSQKMDYKAHIRIIDGTVMAQNGSTIELRYCSAGGTFNAGSCPPGQTVVNPISATTFYNFREGKTIQSADLDITKLRNSPAFIAIQGANPLGVIIYHSDHRNDGSGTKQAAIRMVNGSQLPTNGLTVATENPAYVKGSYNTVSKQPAGIISDAFNMLSNNWNDANSSNSNVSARTATATTLNAAVISGNTTTTTGNYNGGFENIHRFLENWSGVPMTFTGSVVILYNSTRATGGWVYGSPYYTAPVRNWGYDTGFSNPSYNIPGFPSVYNVTKSNWDAN